MFVLLVDAVDRWLIIANYSFGICNSFVVIQLTMQCSSYGLHAIYL